MLNDRSRQEPTFGVYLYHPVIAAASKPDHARPLVDSQLPKAGAATNDRISRTMSLLRSEYDRRRTEGLYTVNQNENLMCLGESFYHAVMPIAIRIRQIHPALSGRPT